MLWEIIHTLGKIVSMKFNLFVYNGRRVESGSQRIKFGTKSFLVCDFQYIPTVAVVRRGI